MQGLIKKTIDDSFLNSTIPIRVSCLKNNGVPTVLSLWYVNIDGKIYCATQKTAKILRYIEKNPVCGFEIAGDSPPYMGIRGEGTIRILSDKGESILFALIDKYLGKKETNLSKFLKKNSKTEVAIEIEPQIVHNYDYSVRMKGVK
jgi:nitroimidazol reductase NimA-like FMN-containing flavoprotein (pyridoxamine 5'-phosphate oxidase superfamily)